MVGDGDVVGDKDTNDNDDGKAGRDLQQSVVYEWGNPRAADHYEPHTL